MPRTVDQWQAVVGRWLHGVEGCLAMLNSGLRSGQASFGPGFVWDISSKADRPYRSSLDQLVNGVGEITVEPSELAETRAGTRKQTCFPLGFGS